MCTYVCERKNEKASERKEKEIEREIEKVRKYGIFRKYKAL